MLKVIHGLSITSSQLHESSVFHSKSIFTLAQWYLYSQPITINRHKTIDPLRLK